MIYRFEKKMSMQG